MLGSTQRAGQVRSPFAAQRLADLHQKSKKTIGSERQVDSGSDWPVRPLIQLVAAKNSDFVWFFIEKCLPRSDCADDKLPRQPPVEVSSV